MAASPSSVLSLGLGSWSSVNLVVTLGFGSAEVAEVHGKLCIRSVSVRPALFGRVSNRPALEGTASSEPALLGKVKVNECR